jgi:hypothetical protein
MKNLIKKILREQMSRLTYEKVQMGFELMDELSKGYNWYHDTPERRFKYSSGNIWLINPNTKQWLVDCLVDGQNDKLLVNFLIDIQYVFFNYIDKEMSFEDVDTIIHLWVEKTLNRRVFTVRRHSGQWMTQVNDVLDRGQILKKNSRGESFGLSDNQYDMGYELMKKITKGYRWYTDTPMRPFRYSTEGSLWLVNPNTKEWMLELDKTGRLWYNRYQHPIYNNFYRYLDMEEDEFESFIKTWVEEVLQTRVRKVEVNLRHPTFKEDEVFKIGVATNKPVG